MRRPLLFLAASLACGCALGAELPAGAAWRLLAWALALLALGVVASGDWRVLALAGAAVAIGAAAAGVETRGHAASPLLAWVERTCPEGPVRLEGMLHGDGRDAADGRLVLLDVDRAACAAHSAHAAGRVRVEVGGERQPPELLDGDRVALWATLRPPRVAGNPAGPDPAAQARRARIHAYGYCKSGALVTVLERGAARGVRAWTAAGRSWARRELSRLLPPGNEEGLVRAMVLGDRSGIDPESEEAFRAAGTYHVLAISGAQVALLAALFAWPLRRAGMPAAATGLLVSASLLVYAQLVGGDVPVVRATCMAVAVLLGLTLDVPSDLANLVGLAGLGLLVHRPSVDRRRRVPALVWRHAGHPAAHAAAARACAAAAAAARRRAGGVAGGTGRPRAPARPALRATGAGGAASQPGRRAALRRDPAGGTGDAGARRRRGAAGRRARRGAGLARRARAPAHRRHRDASGHALDVEVAPPSAWVWMLYAAGVSGVVAVRHGRGAALLAASVLGLVLGPVNGRADGRLHVCVLDVGQGDAIVVRSPNGRVMVVDAGKGASAARATASVSSRPTSGTWASGASTGWCSATRIRTTSAERPFLARAFASARCGRARRRFRIAAMPSWIACSGRRRRRGAR